MVTWRSLSHWATPLVLLIGFVQIIWLWLEMNSGFISKLNVNDRSVQSNLPRSLSKYRSNVVIYNRIPKTGSTSLMQLPYELCNKLKYNVLLLNITGGPRSYTMNLQDRMAFSWNITAWEEKQPAVYHGHFAFLDTNQFPVNQQTNVININMIRRPIDRLVSYYYFLRYGDDFRNKIRSRMGAEKISFDECIERNAKDRMKREKHGLSINKCTGGDNTCDCDPTKLWLQVPWFCGHFQKCWSPPGNSWALQQAKYNLINKHLLVGLTEDMDSFVKMLELLLPQFFEGSYDLFHDETKNLNHVRRTKHKDPISEESIAHLEASKIWKVENEFYEFAESQFKAVKSALLNSNRNPTMQKFHYDKIRPKNRYM